MATTASAFPSLDDVREARRRITGYADTTPLVLRDGLGYKLEFLQHTGSFKVRGAFNAALQLSQAECARGVVAVSGGNHGLAIAYVGKVLGIPATVVMPKATPQFVVERATADGARVVLTETIAEAFARVDELARDGLALLHPFDDVRVIAGQGTLALEMLEQMPEVKTLVVSIGGGGLISGVASTIKQMKPDVTIVGVETKGADAMRQALDAGRPVTLPGITSIARTLGAPSVSRCTPFGDTSMMWSSSTIVTPWRRSSKFRKNLACSSSPPRRARTRRWVSGWSSAWVRRCCSCAVRTCGSTKSSAGGNGSEILPQSAKKKSRRS